jgi:DNA-binding transcriptional LysR family regulator
MYQDLRERNVDFVFGRMLGQTIEKDLTVEVLFDEPIAVAAGMQNRWVRRRRIELAELINEPWILPRPDLTAGALVADTFHACGLDIPQAAVVCSFVHTVSTLLTKGPFLAWLPGSVLRFSSQRPSIRRLSVSLPVQPAPVGLVTLKGRTHSPAAQLFIDCLRKVVKPLAITVDAARTR